ncbi:sensor domain-containing diguanylate cyclase [Thioalkalivibrio sp. ALMg13-2]|uniref:sensor domain-containing diguanylate cyclase n=1 Tax=Thioalkalivibrio sp. ALMg13-2 TaxID=1158167 RepID=UPI000382BA9B|nr:sensor domain-containing diguanylate cyclase [Thioalkalivibrio sp. ALMg13-2]
MPVSDLDLDNTQTLEALQGLLPGFVYQLRRTPDGHFDFPYVGEVVEGWFGVDRGALKKDGAPLLDCIHPEDREAVMASSMESAEHSEPWLQEFRMQCRDGTVVWLSAYDTARRLADGTIIWTGFATDITTHKELEVELRQSEAQFRAFVETASDVIYSLRPDGVLTYVSPNWTENLGHPVSAAIDHSIDEYVAPEDLPACYAFLQRIADTGKKESGIEYRIRHQDGHYRWHTSNVSPVLDDAGRVTVFLGIARDITERKETEAHMQRLAHYDPLTDLPNRTLFFQILDHELTGARRMGQQVALMFVDLDEFKPVNDQHGHAVGDMLLRLVAQRLSGALRDSDVAARIAGDEFVVMLPRFQSVEESRVHAAAIGEKIRAVLADPFNCDGSEVHISCSIGVALFPLDATDGPALSRAADAAMYVAKNAGRNQVVVFDRAVHGAEAIGYRGY